MKIVYIRQTSTGHTIEFLSSYLKNVFSQSTKSKREFSPFAIYTQLQNINKLDMNKLSYIKTT